MNYDGLQNENLIFLKKIGCCLLCSIRFCGINLLEEKMHPDTFISKIRNSQNYIPLKYDETIPCVVCLGILQDVLLSSLINKLMEQLDLFKYDCKTLSLRLNIPIAIQIRERAVYMHLLQYVKFGRDRKSKDKVQNIKDVWKWYITQKIESLLKKQIEISNLFSPFVIDIFISYQEDQKECVELLQNYENFTNEKFCYEISNNKNINKKTIDLIMDTISDDQFEKYFLVPPQIPKNFAAIEKLVYKHDSIFIGGRYVKRSRRLSQTPWFINGECKLKNSVQESLCKYIMEYTKCDSTKFLSSGREDVDVRMLLQGRPFAIEILNPKISHICDSDLVHLNKMINDTTENIKLESGLKILTKNSLKKLKEGEYLKTKSYRALCIFRQTVNKIVLIEKLQNLRNLKIIQNTPLRVLHRRALSPRKRVIYEIRARFPSSKELMNYYKQIKFIKDNCTYIIIDLKTQAGTYVKEFVHGDFGRTKPNLCHLLKTEIDIGALDVTDIALEWP